MQAMKHQTKRNLIGCAFVLALGAVAAAPAVHLQAPLAKDAFKAAEQRVEQQAKADRKGCAKLAAPGKEQCEAQVKAREEIAKARLGAQRKPGLEAEKLAKFKAADAQYDAAKVRCGAQPKGFARDRCMDQAKAARDAAIRLAKVEKVEEQNEIRARQAEAKKALAQARDPNAQQVHQQQQAAVHPVPPKL
jgi:hypothetical protein